MTSIEKLRKIAQAANAQWINFTDDQRLAAEKTLVSKLILAYAEDGDWACTIDALYPATRKWLENEGFTIVGDDDSGFFIQWNNNYKWRK